MTNAKRKQPKSRTGKRRVPNQQPTSYGSASAGKELVIYNDVICFNCRSVVPNWENCANCAAPLSVRADAAANAAAENAVRITATTAVQMDPHLYRLIELAQKQGIRKLATTTADKNEISVIARVTDVEAFKSLGAKVVTASGPVPGAGDWIVTARIPLDNDQIENIRRQPFVRALKASRRLRPCLERTCGEAQATPPQLPNGNQAEGGKGVIIGIIDFGLDFAHKNFRNSNGSSRILALWDQRPKENSRSPAIFDVGARFGTEHKKADIDTALESTDPYATLNYKPSESNSQQFGAHATAVTDVAAGNGLGTGCAGIAPQADIVFVELSTEQPDEIATGSSVVLGNSFGDTNQLVEAVEYIFKFAGDRPCVINISLSTNGGPHDGSTLVEKKLDLMVREAPNRAIVIAAGNGANQNLHAFGQVVNGGKIGLKCRVLPEDPSSSELEVWYPGRDRFTAEIFNPANESVLKLKPGDRFDAALANHGIDPGIVSGVNRLSDSGNGDNLINVFLDRKVPPGIWTIELQGTSVQDGKFHAWIERDEFRQTRFVPVMDNSYQVDDGSTLGSLSCGEMSIVVGAYDAHKPDLPLFDQSGAGPTRNGRQKPEVSAPGFQVLVAESQEITRGRETGTSLSAPAVTGVIALMLAEAAARGISLTADEIRQIVIDSARKHPPPANGQPPDAGGWHRQYGFGRISAADAVEAVMKMTAPMADEVLESAASLP